GHTIPEQLFVYRVRRISMFRTVAEGQHDRLMEEMAGHRRERGTQWTPGSHLAPSSRRSEPAPADTGELRSLEQATRELRGTNARWARSRSAKADSAAATLVARLELERLQLEERRLH